MSSGGQRKATEMIRLSPLVHAALRLYRTDESIKANKRVTDSHAVKMLFEQCLPKYLDRAREILGDSAEEDEDGSPSEE
jgi:hypothetical protein